MLPLVLVNGRFSDDHASWLDRGFQYGDGVFTTLPVRGGQAVLLDRHVARLARDCDRLGVRFDCAAEIADEADRLCRMIPDAVLKIQITRGSGGRGYRIPHSSLPTRVLTLHSPSWYDESFRTRGVTVRVCNHRLGWNAALAGVKHMNRLEQILARAEWSDERVQEGLMLDQAGFLIEGTMSNLFFIQNARLRTPLLDQCGVHGIMRALVLEVAAGHGIPVEQGRFPRAELDRADEMFLTNSVIGLWPVSRIENMPIPVGPLTRRLASLVTHRLEQGTGA